MATTGPVSTTKAANFLPTLWADGIQAALMPLLNLYSLAPRYDSLAVQGAKQIDVPIAGTETASVKDSGTVLTASDADSFTDSVASITFVQNYVYKIVEDIVQIQANEDVMSVYIQAQAIAIAKILNSNFAEVLQADTTNDIQCASDNNATEAQFLEALTDLMKLGVDPADGRTHFHMSPGYFASFATLDLFKSAAIRGQTNGPMIVGQVGQTVHGVNIHVSNNWDSTGGSGLECATMWHESAMVAAVQQQIKVESARSLPNIGDELLTTVIAGATLAIGARTVNFNQLT